MSKLLVSICIITYNQEAFIKQCIDGVLSQRTNFDVEIIINDDNSIDNTSKICRQIAESNVGKIKYIKNTKNLGMIGNWVAGLKRCKGKYIAICEGDDCWVDTLKLQKQVDFMEANLEYSICYHRVWEQYPDGRMVIDSMNSSETEVTYSIEELAKGNIIFTPSVLFKNQFFETFPAWFNESPVADYVVHLLNARFGKIKYFPDVMAVYRIHAGGTWSMQEKQSRLEKWIKVLDFLLSENFTELVITELRIQKRKYVTEYLKLFFQKDLQIFLEKLDYFLQNDPVLGKEWLMIHYPNAIRKLEISIENIKQSKTYRFSQHIGALKRRLLNI